MLSCRVRPWGTFTQDKCTEFDLKANLQVSERFDRSCISILLERLGVSKFHQRHSLMVPPLSESKLENSKCDGSLSTGERERPRGAARAGKDEQTSEREDAAFISCSFVPNNEEVVHVELNSNSDRSKKFSIITGTHWVV